MPIVKKEYILNGLTGYTAIIDNIIRELGINSQCFEIKIILTEAITNAFTHGNNEDTSKPIHIRLISNNSDVRFEIEDCGPGFDNVVIPREINEDKLLAECSRGLYLISCFSDGVELKGNTMIITKHI